MEDKFENNRTIDGNHCLSKKVVGYCHCNLHKGCLTMKQMEEHDCLHKNCPHYKQRPEHPFWQERNKNKAAKKAAKVARQQLEKEQEDVLQAIRTYTANDSDFYAIGAEKTEDAFIIHYIRYGWIDIGQYAHELSQHIGHHVFLKEIKNTLDNKYAILKAQGLV